MTETVVMPSVRRAPGDSDQLLHFACTLHRAAARAAGTPVHCICGKVQVRPRPAQGTRTELRCVVCLDLAPAHLAVCASCRSAVDR